jgi:Family of unknown function (DUF6492)
MLSEVRQALLPLALRYLSRRGDLERTGLLIESLARHWRDRVPFELLIVSPRQDIDLLRRSLPRPSNISVSVRAESDFFPAYSSFYLLPGWYRQQMIKLYVPAKLGFGGYLTLDSDVCCVGDFDATTFVNDRRAMSRWEPKRHHDWWQQSSEFVGVPYDASTHGLSVTPNILHGDLARQTLDCMRAGWFDALVTLGARSLSRIGTIAWTEYSLYTCAAELKGNLFDYHLHWDPSYFHDTQLFSETSCVWGADDFERLAKQSNGTAAGGKFIIVQSHARIPLEQVRDYCLSFSAD